MNEFESPFADDAVALCYMIRLPFLMQAAEEIFLSTAAASFVPSESDQESLHSSDERGIDRLR